MNEGCDKNSVTLETTEILLEFLLPLMRFALSIGRAAAEMSSEARFTGRDVMGNGTFYKEGSCKDGTHLACCLPQVSCPLS
jgi:hypothetical protein